MADPTWQLKILYDGECPICMTEIRWLMRRNQSGVFAFEDITANDFDPSRYGVTLAEVHAVLHGLQADGTMIKGFNVDREILRLEGFRTFAALTALPVISHFCNFGYYLFARYRVPLGRLFGRQKCEEGVCERR